MGDVAEDCYDAAFREMCDVEDAIGELIKTVSSQKVVNDIIFEFREIPVQEDDTLECLARSILITIAKKKRISNKQKAVLLRTLILRSADGYEIY